MALPYRAEPLPNDDEEAETPTECVRCHIPVVLDDEGNWVGDEGNSLVCEDWTGHESDGRFAPMHVVDVIIAQHEEDTQSVHHDSTVMDCPECLDTVRVEAARPYSGKDGMVYLDAFHESASLDIRAGGNVQERMDYRLQITRSDEGIVLDLYVLRGDEVGTEVVATTYVFDHEAECAR